MAIQHTMPNVISSLWTAVDFVADVAEATRRVREGRSAPESGNQVAPDARPAPVAPPPSPGRARPSLTREVGPDLLRSTVVSDLLFRRLDAEVVSAIEASITPEEMAVLDGAEKKDHRWVKLAIGLRHGIPGLCEQTGLSAAFPPDDVHSMSRSWLGLGGSYGHADAIVEAMQQLGVAPGGPQACLDFGCSSGRVSRVMRAAYPQLRLFGCDPNEGAIAWAKANLPGIQFDVSPQEPPLSYADQTFDLVYSISIWSHFGESQALRWLDEMHRVLRPGGHLYFTTHGLNSVAYYAQTKERGADDLAAVKDALFSRNFWYRAEFGGAGDHGVVHEEWGTAFFTPEWVLAHLLPGWSVVLFHSGRECGNQDVYVLRRN